MPEMTAEERIQAIEREWACGVHSGKADGMTVLELRQSILKEHILAAQREAEERVLERCAEIAREQAWSHARSGMENGPELNSQAIYDAIIAEREKDIPSPGDGTNDAPNLRNTSNEPRPLWRGGGA